MTSTSRRYGARFWIVTAATVLAMAGTFSLGQWQLRRAAQKVALQEAVDSQTSQSVVDMAGLTQAGDLTGLIHRRATLKGTWLQAHTVYLDNRPMDSKSGFIVVTPLALADSAKVILVQRGWVQRNFTDRTALPAITTPEGLVTVMGRIAPPPSKLYEFKGADTGRIRQNLDLPAFRLETGLPLLDVSLQQQDPASEGLLRDWPAPNLGLERHYGYAFQWFSLSALLVILYAWFQFIAPYRKKKSGQTT